MHSDHRAVNCNGHGQDKTTDLGGNGKCGEELRVDEGCCEADSGFRRLCA